MEGKDLSFPAEEEKVLKFWKDIDAFKQQLKLTEGKKEYVFYDGPPFATGLPHYGHILAGTLKVCRHLHSAGRIALSLLAFCHGGMLPRQCVKLQSASLHHTICM